MQIYIDQSSKIEDTSQKTVVAFANHKQKSLMIQAEDKRKLEQVFRGIGKPQMFIYKTFAILIYLLIKDDLTAIRHIVIDREYIGKERIIKHELLNIIRTYKRYFDKDDVQFDHIGKKSPAHRRAIEVFRNKTKPTLIVDYKDVVRFIK